MDQIVIDGIRCRYAVYGDKGKDVLLLHGWGQNIEMMAYIGLFLGKHFKVYALDLPGFGQSGEPDRPYSVHDYMIYVRHFCEAMDIEEPIIIAHSFGCRIAFHYAYTFPVRRMVLTGAAGLLNKRGPLWYAKTYSYKAAKKVLSIKPFRPALKRLQERLGSEDYKNTSGVMRETFIKVVNDDVKGLLAHIKTETLLVYGQNDEATPLWMGKEIERRMPDCALVIFENDDHYAYFHQADRFNLVLEAFLKRDYDTDR